MKRFWRLLVKKLFGWCKMQRQLDAKSESQYQLLYWAVLFHFNMKSVAFWSEAKTRDKSFLGRYLKFRMITTLYVLAQMVRMGRQCIAPHFLHFMMAIRCMLSKKFKISYRFHSLKRTIMKKLNFPTIKLRQASV